MLPARASPATGHKRRRKSLCRHHRHRQFNGFPLIGHLVRRHGKFKRNSPAPNFGTIL